jgi:hypothetical protein
VRAQHATSPSATHTVAARGPVRQHPKGRSMRRNIFASAAAKFFGGRRHRRASVATATAAAATVNPGYHAQPLEPRLMLALFEPDIVQDGITGVQTAYDVGERITARAHFYNNGNIGTGAFTVRFYLARQGQNQVAFIESGNVANLSPLLAWSEDINLPGWAIPHENHNITPGRYRIAAYLDWGNAVAETSESNNIAFSSFFDIRHPDLVTESVTGVDTHYAPGSALNVTAAVKNNGIARAWASLLNPYRVTFYLGADQSTPPNPSAMAVLQEGWIQGNLDNGETTTDLLNTLVPLSTWPGRYKIWVMVDADNELVESNEGNNWRSSNAFTVSGPDLKPLPVTGLADYYSPTFGQFINADVAVQNIGATAVVGSSLHWYLGPASTANPPSAGQLQLLQNANIRPMLSEGETSDHLLYAVSGLEPGHYRIWAHADPQNEIGEQDESNNWSYSDAFRIITIDGLRWENAAGAELTAAVDEGTQVYISFDASGFDTGGYIPVEIWEDDVLDDELEREDLRVRYAGGGRWRAPWWPAWSEDAGGTDPEFYFHIPADHLGFTFGYSSSNLSVNPRHGPDLDCDDDTDPNPIDFGFQISHHTVGTGVPLVLVHGNNSDNAGKLYRWQWFENYIRNNPADFAEFDVFVWRHDTCKPVGFNGAPDSQADSLANYIYNQLQVGVPGTPYENRRVALVAHSQGGMVSRSFMNHANQGDDVSGLITLGTPHHGSPFGVPDWVAAVWQATDGEEPLFTVLRNRALDTDRHGTINLAWDNFDGAIADPWTTDFLVNDYDLTDRDMNAPASPATDDRTPYYPGTFKDSFGTLAQLNAAEAYYHKLVTIGAYDPDFSDNASFAGLLADVAAGLVSPDLSSEHDQLSAVTTILGDMSMTTAGNANGSPYYANDGLVPLQSALFLDISPYPGGTAALFSSRDGDSVTIDAGLIAARTPRDLKAHYFSVGAKDHQDILDSTSSQYWQTIAVELRALLDDVIPTASLHRPGDGEPVGRDLLNRRGYFDFAFHDLGGSGLDPRSILDDAPEFLLSGAAGDQVTLTGVQRGEGDTYRYFFNGQFAHGNVTLSLLPGAFGDDAGNFNANVQLTFLSVIDGDADGNGRINADDYFRIDSSFLDQPANPSYAQGDFNDDARINADDYFIIDQSFLTQPSVATPPSAGTFADARVTSAAPVDVLVHADDDDRDDTRKRRLARAARPTTDVFATSHVRPSLRA